MKYRFAGFLTLLAALAAQSVAQPTSPVYKQEIRDAVTGDNAFGHGGKTYWDIDAGSDSYQNDFYERPTAQSYEYRSGRYSAKEYFEYIDITKVKYGYDAQFFYVKIMHFGRDKVTEDGTQTPEGMKARYGFRLAEDANGRNGSLFVADQPESTNGTTYGRLKTYGYTDTNGDVGGADVGGLTGLSVTRSDNAAEEFGLNGFDDEFISDGRLDNGTTVLWSRLAAAGSSDVELALDYRALGWDEDVLLAMQYVQFESIKGDPKDPQKYLWNDKYFNSEAGSPVGGGGGLSEFGTQGCVNIYELDTLSGVGIVPEPATLLTLGCLSVWAARRRGNRR